MGGSLAGGLRFRDWFGGGVLGGCLVPEAFEVGVLAVERLDEQLDVFQGAGRGSVEEAGDVVRGQEAG
ncbi:hypothetical protein [Streptomyces sp. NPDC088183]|uniref:hypothetical protein n=1 Tax=Streptomyces sp. NPDC088183 TaxID=3160992 RepID=UPI00341D0EA5